MRIDPNTGLTDAEALSYNTVRIEIEYQDRQQGIGTGFLYNFRSSNNTSVPSLVTNRHVLENAQDIKLKFNPTGEDKKVDLNHKNSQIEIIMTEMQNNRWYGHPNLNIDLAFVPLSKALNDVHKELKNTPYMLYLAREHFPNPIEWTKLTALEPIVIVGYPTGIWDPINIMPIFRRGVTATHPKMNFMGKPEFLVDAAVFLGSSGSPVFLYEPRTIYLGQELNMGKDRPRLVGILSMVYHYQQDGEMKSIPIPTLKKKIPFTNIPNNLGIAIRSIELDGFIPLIDNLLKKN